MIVKTPKSAFDGIVAPNRINYQLFFSITPFSNPAIREFPDNRLFHFHIHNNLKFKFDVFLNSANPIENMP